MTTHMRVMCYIVSVYKVSSALNNIMNTFIDIYNGTPILTPVMQLRDAEAPELPLSKHDKIHFRGYVTMI